MLKDRSWRATGWALALLVSIACAVTGSAQTKPSKISVESQSPEGVPPALWQQLSKAVDGQDPLVVQRALNALARTMPHTIAPSEAEDAPLVSLDVRAMPSGVRYRVRTESLWITKTDALRALREAAEAAMLPPKLAVSVAGESLSFPLDQLLHEIMAWKRPFTGIVLRYPAARKAELDEFGALVARDSLIAFGNYLSGYYEDQFGALAGQMMWQDLERAAREKRPYLAANLLLSMPKAETPKGEQTWFFAESGVRRLAPHTMRMLQQFALRKDLDTEVRRIFVDQLAAFGDTRCIDFLFTVASLQDEPLWLRGTGLRALLRLQFKDQILQGETRVMHFVASQDTEQALAQHAQDQEALAAYWAKERSRLPQQIMP